MNILPDTSLSHYVTMRIGGPAKLLVSITNEQELVEAIEYARSNNLEHLVIGQGSNIIFSDEGFDGMIIINQIPGLLIDTQTGIVRIGAGTNWHEVVVKTVEAGLVGIEAMALIPGTSGATPINNVGAYGQEISNVIQNVHAYDTEISQFVELSNTDCKFSYRNSIFKSTCYGRYIISSITLQLQPVPTDYQPPRYAALEAELMHRDILYPTPQQVVDCVIAIRSAKLPNPNQVANTGSFFKNPIVTKEKVEELLVTYPSLPHYPQTDGSEKVAAGWLIEQAGLKGFTQQGISVSEKQALVIINDGQASFSDLQAMITTITQAVQDKFAITLEPEPEIIR